MGHLHYSFTCLVLAVHLVTCQVLSFSKGSSDQSTVNFAHSPPVIQVASNELPGVRRTASDLATDFGRVTGTNGTLVKGDSIDKKASIIIGTIGSSKIIDSLITKGKLDVSSVKGKWESYVQQVVDNPADGAAIALVIAGSDRRGTIYGTYDVSETIGFSPWHWWADVPPKKKTDIILIPNANKTHGPPSVKYRGIFINDEMQLIDWAKGKFPQSPRGGYFTGDFFRLVFELLLRLRANYLWPGMKRKEAFYLDDPENGQIANEYGILMGTSHHEPMARAFNEQKEFVTGAWDWGENQKNITEFMKAGVNRSTGWETIYTMGMRGVDDSENKSLTAKQLEEILKAQQDMIKNVTGRKLEDVPQTWVHYKEVGKYWQEGMNVSDSVTFLFTDDNFGNLLRVPLANETDRKAGAGIYYHFGYVGPPRDYEWINTIQLVKTWEQMHLGYHRNARQIWIANVQDLKPYELPMNHFLDMAYDMTQFESPNSTTEWLKRWAEREFGPSVRDVTAEIYNTYGRLLLRRKYETLTYAPFAFNPLAYDEAERVLKEWNDLLDLATEAHDSLPADIRDTYYELVLHTISAGKNVLELYIKKHLGDLYKSQKRTSTNTLASEAHAAYQKDAADAKTYYKLFGGKWDKILGNKHIGYDNWLPPPDNIMPNISWYTDKDKPTTGEVGIAVQGRTMSTPGNGILSVHSMNNYMAPDDVRYIDVFTRANGTFTYKLESNVSYVTLTNSEGTLKSPGNSSDTRSIIKVDWAKAPDGLSSATFRLTQKGSDAVDVAHIYLNKDSVPKDFTGFVQSGLVVSMEPGHYSSITKGANDTTYVEIPWYGRTSSGIKLWPITTSARTPANGPKITYPFFSFTEKHKAKLILHLSGSLNHDPTEPLSIAHALDNDTAVTTRVIKDYRAGTVPTAQGWNNAVITGGWNLTTELNVTKGAHSLNLWLLQPGVVVQKIVLDLGGMQRSALGPPESFLIR